MGYISTQNNRFDRILLASGGIDSFVAYYYLKNPQTLYFNINNRYSEKEILVVRSLFSDIIIDSSLNLGEIECENANIPFRNLFFSCMAAAKYSDLVYIAGLKDDLVSDKNKPIFERFSSLLSELENRVIKIDSPFWNMTKVDVINWYLDSGFPKDKLLQTVSCYSSNKETYCGKCACCFRKWASFWAVGIKLDYFNTNLMEDYKERCKNGKYDLDRCNYTLKAISEYEKSSN